MPRTGPPHTSRLAWLKQLVELKARLEREAMSFAGSVVTSRFSYLEVHRRPIRHDIETVFLEVEAGYLRSHGWTSVRTCLEAAKKSALDDHYAVETAFPNPPPFAFPDPAKEGMGHLWLCGAMGFLQLAVGDMIYIQHLI